MILGCRRLAESRWVGKHRNIFITPTNSPTQGQPNPTRWSRGRQPLKGRTDFSLRLHYCVPIYKDSLYINRYYKRSPHFGRETDFFDLSTQLVLLYQQSIQTVYMILNGNCSPDGLYTGIHIQRTTYNMKNSVLQPYRTVLRLLRCMPRLAEMFWRQVTPIICAQNGSNPQ